MGCYLSKKSDLENIACELRVNREIDSVKRDKLMTKLDKIERKIELLSGEKNAKKTSTPKRYTTGYYASGL